MVRSMGSLDDLQRAFFDGLYTYRIPIAIGSIVLAVVGLLIAWRAGWFAAARRHPGRSGALFVAFLAVALPLTYYVASPIWIRTELIEPDPVAGVISSSTSTPIASRVVVPSPSTTPSDPPVPAPTPFVATPVATGSFHGTDEFHFGRGTAAIIETAPGRFTLRFADFSVRNGPDLFVYLSPDAGDYARGALELGRLKATDGAFGYELPPGTDPADFASAIIWCKQFSHLFAVAPLSAA